MKKIARNVDRISFVSTKVLSTGQFYCSELCLDILGVPHCPDESDESVTSCANRVANPLAGDSSKKTTYYIIGIVVGLGSVALLCVLFFCIYGRICSKIRQSHCAK
jgi:hypothetical protein